MFGLYISDVNVLTAKASGSISRLVVSKSRLTALPDNLVINGYIQDEAAFSTFLKGVLSGYSKSEKRKFALQVDSTTIIYRDLQIPNMNKKALEQYVYNTMQAQIANADEYYLDYAITPDDTASGYRVFVAAIPRRLVKNYRQLLWRLGIKKFSFGLPIVSLMQWKSRQPVDPEGPVQIVAGQFGNLTKTILYSGSRYVIANNVRQTNPADPDHIQQLSQRISDLMQFQSVKDAAHKVSKVYIAADNAATMDALPGLKTAYNCEVSAVEPGPGLTYRGEVDFAVLAGLAGCFMPFAKTIDFNQSDRFDLLNPARQASQRQGSWQKIILINLAAVVLGGAVLWGWGCYYSRQAKDLQAKLDDPAFVSDYQQALAYSAKAAALTTAINERKGLEESLQGQKIVDAAFISYTRQLAVDINITSYTISSYQNVVLIGSSASRTAAADFVSRLRSETDRYGDVVYTGFDYSSGVYSFRVSFTALKGVDSHD